MSELKKIIGNIFQNDILQNSDKVGAKTYGNWSSKDWSTGC